MNKFTVLVFLFIAYNSEGQVFWKFYETNTNIQNVFQNDGDVILQLGVGINSYELLTLDNLGNIASKDEYPDSNFNYRTKDRKKVDETSFVELNNSNIPSIESVEIKYKTIANEVIYEHQFINASHFVLGQSISIGSNNDFIATGAASLKTSTSNVYKPFIFDLANQGSETNEVFIEVEDNYIFSLGAIKTTAGHYIALCAQSTPTDLNSIGESQFGSPFLVKVSADGNILETLDLSEHCDDFASRAGFNIGINKNGIYVSASNYIFSIDEDFNILWDNILPINLSSFQLTESEILLSGHSSKYGSSGLTYYSLDLSGNILQSNFFDVKKYGSVNNQTSISRLDSGHLIIGVNLTDFGPQGFKSYLSALSLNENGTYNNLSANDMYLECDKASEIHTYKPVYTGECTALDTSREVIFDREYDCNSCVGFSRLIGQKWKIEDSCGSIDSIIQFFHFKPEIPEVECCDLFQATENLEGANVIFSEPIFTSNCTDYIVNVISGSDISTGSFLEYGTYSKVYVITDNCGVLNFEYEFIIDVLEIDEDEDGYNSGEDCDDMNSAINPGAIEIANNQVDEDCDGQVLIIDEDNDGFNSNEDCDDMNSAINPDAMEIPNNQVDENCDGEILIIDEDNDGYNSSEDCDDMNTTINPGAIEIANNQVDEDCDGEILIIDEDNDGYNSSEDCDDMNSSINPGAEEIANNGIDEDCDGLDLLTNIIEENINIEIFPNPVKINSLLTLNPLPDNASIKWYDSLGKIISVNELKTNSIQVPTEHGLYFIKIFNSESSYSHMIYVID